MADIRIKDLTTTASSTASDDFIAVDGTTNGTRKLSAFSPTFGGNATVTGTLTVNGATGSLGSSASAATSLKLTVGVGTNASPKYRTIDFRNYDDSKSQAYIRAANRETDSNASTIEVAARSSGDVLTSIATFSDSQLSIAATTASTTTSSGALVVGNGTSGGLGVGGAVNIGGTLSVLDGGTASSAGTIRLSNNTSIGWRNAANSADIFLTVNNSNIFSFGSGAPVYVNNSTASTSTSSGALVVSGGLGVAGAIYAGGNIVLSPASVAASGEIGNLRIADSSNTNRKLFFGLDNTVSPNGVGYIQSTLTGTTTIPLQLQPLGGSLSVGNSGTVVTLNGTTASTSTSSGALVVSGGVGVVGAVNAGTFYGLVDGVTAPGTESGYARIYIDSADGDLKVKFGDGTVKTIATDS